MNKTQETQTSWGLKGLELTVLCHVRSGFGAMFRDWGAGVFRGTDGQEATVQHVKEEYV